MGWKKEEDERTDGWKRGRESEEKHGLMGRRESTKKREEKGKGEKEEGGKEKREEGKEREEGEEEEKH